MDVRRAAEAGMCFGVRDALAAMRAIDAPGEVTIHGELVHNPAVLAELTERGFRQSPEVGRAVPATPAVLVTAHGISERERARLAGRGKRILDTTCPLVAKAHQAAQMLQAEGRRVVVLGRRDHVEVRGIVEDLRGAIVVADIADIGCWFESRLGVVAQTTTQVAVAEALLAVIRERNPAADVRFVDTVCSPTRSRIAALEALLPDVDGVVVVGGRHSNNTRQLVVRAESAGVPTLHVEGACDLVPPWLAGKRIVGLTAGTSTLDATIDEVEAALRRWPAA